MPDKRPLILVDRDGTLIEEGEYLADPRKVRLLPGVAAGLKRLRQAGFRVVVTSNQSGVGRGLVTLTQLRLVNQRFLQLLKKAKAPVNGLYWCPHKPSDHCACRKPKLGMVKRAARDLKTSWKKSISVGDRASDVELGQRTKGQGILVLTGYGRLWAKTRGAAKPDHTSRDFKTAALWIIRRFEMERKRR